MDEIGSPKWKAQTFDKHGIAYPRTEKGNPSFRGGKTGWMVHASALAAAAHRERDQIRHHRHQIPRGPHPRPHHQRPRLFRDPPAPLGRRRGTCSLRFSYSDPPLQQMPSRDKELAPLVRGVFLPEEGEVWAKPDISQQEFRFVVHYAVLRNIPRANEAAELYRTDPDADFHAWLRT